MRNYICNHTVCTSVITLYLEEKVASFETFIIILHHFKHIYYMYIVWTIEVEPAIFSLGFIGISLFLIAN